jgi:hypothetical protein
LLCTPTVRSVWIALAVVLAALLGFVAAFVPTFLIMLVSDVRPECDGVCFNNPWVAPVSYGAGAVGAILASLAALRISNRYFAKPS